MLKVGTSTLILFDLPNILNYHGREREISRAHVVAYSLEIERDAFHASA